MIFKEVKEYGEKSKRKRIDINKADDLEAGAKIVIMTVPEHDGIKENIINLTNQLRTAETKLSAKKDEIKIYQNQEQNLKQIIEDVTSPIEEHYKKELNKKQDKIDELEAKLNELQTKTNDFKLDMMGLNAIEILLLRKHKKRIRTFDEDLKLASSDPPVINANALPNEEGSGDNET